MAKGDGGFKTMDKAKQRTIASHGGRAAHEQGVAHEWTSAAAREAGRLGGLRTAQRRRERDAAAANTGSEA